ncbi:hypothetical protein RRG08_005579 [Elysia crispata]|uniref:Uncharacterized protein n=1 Tax=Elysia crispata TaxID=231223 RepID=A0AAE1EEI9_9GAST|nr:hypothetical protein RRG08_005579 [Elysia crispata]
MSPTPGQATIRRAELAREAKSKATALDLCLAPACLESRPATKKGLHYESMRICFLRTPIMYGGYVYVGIRLLSMRISAPDLSHASAILRASVCN